jgi:hypothetical protein
MKFIADAPLGRLVKWLRILGFDTLYYRTGSLTKLVEWAEKENRIILTRNHKLKDLLAGTNFLFITQNQPRLQLREVIQAYQIKINKDMELFSRCLLCNLPLEEIAKVEVAGRVPEYVYDTQEQFFTCRQCHRIYWPGTHLQKMQEEIEGLG